ncbi:sensor domain-containing protein [Streptomyces filamentosus]|uniref:histidine kinase n=5 Tax=Streptomyces TaxID=1883 RepID=A0ABY4V243_STRFL|nr:MULTISPECIES: sensor histidine kinase [Streptomyces]EFE73996.1 two-component system sensor kinase [Streptomyces filamentosus NRRL 15998]EWS91145.1 two-component system sensor kinase [Streptomyces filamentosus NRRL 11379]MYR78166.1 sensor histidine kinase [Streptomyces sp. SID5466]NEC19668.1 sensor histidine kinase [Streptomyces parvus]USC50192.1 sensor domain-containing protein [Streptomyces filamentosus]
MKAMTGRLRPSVLAAGRGLFLFVAAMTVSVTLFVLAVISISFILLGIGVFTTPVVLEAVRKHANQRRLWAMTWSDVRIPVPYRPFPKDLRSGVTGQVERTTLMLRDPATWRDMQWLLIDMTVGAVVAFVGAALMVYPVEGLVLAAGLWRVFRDDPYWYGFVPVDSQATAFAALALGIVLFHVGLWASRPLLRLHFSLARTVLAPTRDEELAQRVERLTETRHEAVDTAAAELRRIERDLHDGAQARLVAMGMNLGTIEALIEKDPAQAKKLLAMARESSAEALTELRDLVRGIHPPVLAERGLGDAVRALALRLPLASEVAVELPGRAEAPVESAAYFAVSEALTNAVKHAEAERVYVDLHHAEGMLRISVTDDGRGGAAIGSGSGLSGIERRLGTFDGVLAVSSPAGGPTMVTMEIPCELS